MQPAKAFVGGSGERRDQNIFVVQEFSQPDENILSGHPLAFSLGRFVCVAHVSSFFCGRANHEIYSGVIVSVK